MIYGDPRAEAEYESARGTDIASDRLVRVPVVIPGIAGAGWPVNANLVADTAMVRACPERHRFDPSGPYAMRLWNDLAERDTVLALDAAELGLSAIAIVARAVPKLRILVLSPGYRELLRIAELLETLPGLYLETGTVISAGGLEWLARTAGAHRLVFGTGAPLWDSAGPRFQLDHLNLSQQDVELIAHGSWDRMTGATA